MIIFIENISKLTISLPPRRVYSTICLFLGSIRSVRVLFHCIYSSKRQSSNILITNKIDGSSVNLYLTFSIETLMTPKGRSCCLTWNQKKRLNPICFIPISTEGVSTQIFVWLKFNYLINLLLYHCVIDAWDHELGQKVSVFTFNGECIIVKPLRSLR